MTVDDLWYELLHTLDDKSNPNSVAGKHLRKLIDATKGQDRFRRGIKEKLKTLPLLRLFAQIIDPSEPLNAELNKDVRRDLLEESVNAAAVFAEKDAIFWRFRWLQLASGQSQITQKLSQELHRFNDGCGPPIDMANRFKALAGWADFPKVRWVELFEKALDMEPSMEFRSHLQKVVQVLRGGGQPPAKPTANSTPPPAVPVAGQPEPIGPRAPEPPQAKTVASQPATPTAAKVNRSQILGPTVESKPPHDTPPQSGEPPVPNAAVEEKPGTGQEKAIDPSAPTVVLLQAGEDIVAPPGETLKVAPAFAKQDASKAKEASPKKAVTKKTAIKEATVPTSPTDPQTGDGSPATGSSEPAKPPSAGKSKAATGGELPAVLTELATAVRSILGRLDQIASRTGDGANLEQRLVELERRLAGVERALTDTRSDAERSRDEVERLQACVREREQEFGDAIRERDTTAARAGDLARRLASADSRITAAESRADQNIHEAFRERDAAVLTFKARLWGAVQAQLSDVTDPTPGEEFASTEEEVLTTRLRSIRDTLRAEGVQP